jgi:hypothetical protein
VIAPASVPTTPSSRARSALSAASNALGKHALGSAKQSAASSLTIARLSRTLRV